MGGWKHVVCEMNAEEELSPHFFPPTCTFLTLPILHEQFESFDMNFNSGCSDLDSSFKLTGLTMSTDRHVWIKGTI